MGYIISLVSNLSGFGVFGISLVAFIAGVFVGRWFEKDKCNKEKEALNNTNKTTSNAFFNDHKTEISALSNTFSNNHKAELSNLKNDHKAEIIALKLSNDARIAVLESECKEKIETLKNDHIIQLNALKKPAVVIEEFDLVCKIRDEKHRIDTAIANERGIFVAIGAPKIKTRFKDGAPYFCDCKLLDFADEKRCAFSNNHCIILSSRL